MAENREPPPDLFEEDGKISDDEALVKSKSPEDTSVNSVEETVEVNLKEESPKEENDDTTNIEAVVDNENLSEDNAENEAEKPSENESQLEEEDSELKEKEKDKPRVSKVTFDTAEDDEDEKNEEEDLELEETDEFDIKIKVSDPEKVGDGMGAFMQYKVTTMTSLPKFKHPKMVVSRRFSDFLGLHERLNAKYLAKGMIVPPAPEKSVVGMTKVKLGKEESASADFVERRRASLERYLNRTASHPTLREDAEFRQFLEMESLPKASGTSAFSGGGLKRLVKNMGDTVFTLTNKIEEADQWFEDKHNKIDDLETQLKKLYQSLESLVHNRKELSTSIAVCSNGLAILSDSDQNNGLKRALSILAEVEEKVDKVIQNQMDSDFFILVELLKDYLGLVNSVKMCFHQRLRVFTNLQTAQQTLTKKREALVKAELASKSDRVSQFKDEVNECEKKLERCQDEFKEISNVIKKEFVRFERNRRKDFRDAIIKYLEALLENQEEILKHWEGYLPEAKEIA
ncbi:sorting nexin-2-like [Xenia sp. Carnegie-2017]|uniref:sorting nexin-2-like n=1 Tax=Xenia sp. Carnegie-2017 TaxID=2897299 RepID=UPI001F04AB35|nr:sorting nexin-2-like [Xenia sp. Carnegie-2017]